MKWSFLTIFCLTVVVQLKVEATTVRPLTFDKVISQADVVTIGFIYEGKTAARDFTKTGFQTPPKYCAHAERAISGEYEGDSVCFFARAGLKIGVPYLLFLSRGEDVDSNGEPVSYVGSLALEIAEPNSFHDFRAVRWEAIRDPVIPGLVEDKALVDYQDASDITNKQSIVVYSYFPLKAVEKTVRQLKSSNH
ncbi:hypothetical protein [Microbulbifer thermotolerans]|uniref:Uncharacterized protein n=1 Tax=Microbulbifer thermotolerans TaxID=252514 RepID=A0A143HKB4_MICTH|nr:hypothetical protein [Microbulbifer thermotolerans]AMX01941.1 hypothetical protein A3224_04490 [Microbulbifer thermotolerans]MCX2800789.1 hypothetical protein [Microbulbifer thermotolerans]WKT61473.1 hypothetical protein Q2E61_04595 [Microbulbifer thermotolerans]